jgi:hypothetical protein
MRGKTQGPQYFPIAGRKAGGAAGRPTGRVSRLQEEQKAIFRRRKEKGTSQTQRPASPQRSGPEVGRRIRQMRGFDMTHEEFAERIGINQNYSLERGKGGAWGGDPA